MDKVAFLIGIGGLYWSLRNMNKPTSYNVGIAIASLVVLNVSVGSMLQEPQHSGGVAMVLQK